MPEVLIAIPSIFGCITAGNETPLDPCGPSMDVGTGVVDDIFGSNVAC